MLFKDCIVCDKKYIKKPSVSKKAWLKTKYCSNKCSLENTGFKKGHKKSENWYKVMSEKDPWNKGTIGVMKPNSGSFKKGNDLGSKHRLWKGEDAGIKPKHAWVKRHKGKAKECTQCDKTSETHQIDWANIDHKYKRNLDDYIELCRSCHRLYDIANNNYKLKR